MSASKIDFTIGTIRPASSGRKSIQINELGDFVIVDDAGISVPLGGVNDHPSLTNRDDADQHPISSITDLTQHIDSIYNNINDAKDHSLSLNRNLDDQHPISAITGLELAIDDQTQHTDTKEDMLGNPSASGMHLASDVAGNRYWDSPLSVHEDLSGRNDFNQHNIGSITDLQSSLNGKESVLGNPASNGMHLASDTSGNRSWVEPPVQEKQHFFTARNEIWQSFSSQSEIVTEWNMVTVNHPKFVHDPINSPDEIQINHTGFIQIFCKMNLESNVTSRIFHRMNISLDWSWIAETISYAWCRHRDYVDVSSNMLAGVIIPVVSGQILRVHNQIAKNDDSSSLGDQQNVNTVWGESTITIATVVEP